MLKIGKVLAAVVIGASTLLGGANGASAATETFDVGAHQSTFTGFVRGYWFTAPEEFVITGIDVPLEASTANFNAAILRLDDVPPTYSGETTNFEVLYQGRDQASGVTGLSISISAGDVIGVLGNRGDRNSYGAGSYVTSSLGNDVTLERFGSQFALSSAPIDDQTGVWTESGSIGRVFLTVSNDVVLGQPSPVPLPASVPLLALGLGTLFAVRRRNAS